MPPSKSIEIAGANVSINTHTTTISMESKVAGMRNTYVIPNADLSKLYVIIGQVLGSMAYEASKKKE